MLRLNKDMWSEKTVQDIIDDKKAVNRERARLRAETAEKAKRLKKERKMRICLSSKTSAVY